MKKAILLLALSPTLCLGQWNQLGNSMYGQGTGDYGGYSVAISDDGTFVAMGSPNNDNGASNVGQVQVFGLASNSWYQVGAEINGETFGDNTGRSVSLSADGSILAIGEPMNNDLGFTSGQVRVYKNINNTWVQIGADLYGDNASADAGRSVDLSSDGSVLAFGAPNTTVNGVPAFIGTVRVFEQQNNNWIQKGQDINGDGVVIKFGQSVKLSSDGNKIAIGQTGDPLNGEIGRVFVYEFANNQWTQLGDTIIGTAIGDEFGWRLGFSDAGDRLAIGTYEQNEVKVFELQNGNWSQLGNTLIGENTGDAFGFGLSLSGDGTRLAVGARFYSTDGFRRGRAYVYEFQDGSWVQIDNHIAGVAAEDQNGFSVALSQDGSRVAIGSTQNDDIVDNGGQVRVFENSSLSMDELNNGAVRVYPNPSNEFVHIESERIILSYTICSVDGKGMHNETRLDSYQFTIDLTNLQSGIYVLQLSMDKGTEQIQIVKE